MRICHFVRVASDGDQPTKKMSITTNTTSLTTEEIIAQVTAHNEFFAPTLGTPATQSFVQAEDGHLVETSSIYPTVVISNI